MGAMHGTSSAWWLNRRPASRVWRIAARELKDWLGSKSITVRLSTTYVMLPHRAIIRQSTQYSLSQ